ncbi:protein kinase [Slackia faecicanis]|uniref:Protein kinase n=1 Tax=Slackia faecicanis TaxID=255723 RepID=A0A3N0AGN5_9ACTN|nr:AarF/UbiB family protein [Slackia faecicanis]RNL20649.1 protein kinase [Slackia faecicanis]
MARAKSFVQIVRDGLEDTTSAARLREITRVLRRTEVSRGLTPEKLVTLLEELGPTFIKLGQILSSRSDMLPQEYCNALQTLRSSTTPEPFEHVVERLKALYGDDCMSVFSDFDEEPLGSASIAQVYKAHLAEDGTAVAVKVRRDHVKEDMQRDIQLMRRAADLLNLTGSTVLAGVDIVTVIDEFDRTVREEIDFTVERDNLLRFARGVRGEKGVSSPAVYPGYSDETVLVMEFVEGISLERVDELKEAGYNLRDIGDRLANSYMHQMVDTGFFHADPHAANVIVRPALTEEERADGKKDRGEVVWIDCGMMGELSPHERGLFFDMMKAMVFKDGHALTDLFIEWGRVSDAPGKKLDYGRLLQELTTLVNRYAAEDAYSMDIAALLNDIMSILDTANVIMPRSFVMLVRGLASLQGTLLSLTPEISILKVVETYIKQRGTKRFDPVKEVETRTMAAVAAADKAVEIPGRIVNVLDMAEKGRLKLGFDLAEANQPMEKLGHIVDRLSLAIITAGLFIGSSMIYSTDMQPQLFGVPIVGFLGYFGAAVLSLYIIHKIRKGC